MKKLSKVQRSNRETLVRLLESARDDVVMRLGEFNEAVSARHAALSKAVARYNDTVTKINEHMSRVHGEQEDYVNEKSERWQESDAGSAYSDWMAEWELELDTLDLDPCPSMEMPDFDDNDSFERLEEEGPS